MSDRQTAGAVPRHEMDSVERMVNRILTTGIAVSVALMAVGVVLSVAGGEGLPSRVVPVGRLLSELAALDPAAFLSLGLVVLIATPLARVTGSLVAFVRLRERRYVLVTAVVLAVMCVSVVVGRG